MKRDPPKDALVAIMNNPRDFRIAETENWYRIPVRTAPENVRTKKLRFLAFYHTKVFGKQAYSIHCYGEVRRISIVRRKDLFPDLRNDPKAEDEYYKIELHKLERLTHPIVSHRLRRILFISTTFFRLTKAREINEVFYESPIEERFWDALRSEDILAERQYLVGTEQQFFYLDFALFCRDGNIDVECDGDAFHTQADQVKRDKKRNNILATLGWSVLRFTTEDIRHRLEESIQHTKQTINRQGGLQDIEDPTTFRHYPGGPERQLDLFSDAATASRSRDR